MLTKFTAALLGMLALFSTLPILSTAQHVGFIFPQAEHDDFSDDDAQFVVKPNDTFIIKYDVAPSVEAVGIRFICYDSLDTLESFRRNETETMDWGKYPFTTIIRIFENTGYLSYGMNESDIALQTKQTLCQFELYNETIASCLWGPWGVVETRFGKNSGQFMQYSASHALYRSALMRLKAMGRNGEPVQWEPASASASAAGSTRPITALPTTAVECPPSGIPPRAAATPVAEMFPPLAAGVKYPWTLAESESEPPTFLTEVPLPPASASSQVVSLK